MASSTASPRSNPDWQALQKLKFCAAENTSATDRNPPWIDALRSTLPGRLVLGSTFNWLDLSAYAVGIGLGAWVERRLRR